MTPDFRISANGADFTAKARDRLLSLTITEADGEEADRMELTLDDRDNRLETPPLEALISVSLGYRETGLSQMGLFEVEGIRGDGPPDQMTITATAVDLRNIARAPRTKAHEDRSLRDIATEIAGRAGLTLVLGESLAAVKFAYLAQTAESDIHFLTRIAQGLDATAKAAAGKLVVARRSDKVTAAGDAKTPVQVRREELTSWSFDISAREAEGTVEAEAQLTESAEKKLVTVGSGEPKRRLRHVFASEDEARQHAEATLARSGRDKTKVDVTLARFEPALFAGGLVRLTGLRPELAGVWHISSIRHHLAGAGLTTKLSAKRGEDT